MTAELSLLPPPPIRGRVGGMYQPADYPPDVLRALWHIHRCSDHVVVGGVECAARFFHPDAVKLFSYDTQECLRTMTAAEFVAESGAALDVPFVPPYLYGWMFGEAPDGVIPTEHLMSANPSMPSFSTAPADCPVEDRFSLPATSPLLARRTAGGSW